MRRVTILLTILLLLAACGGDSETTTPTPDSGPPERPTATGMDVTPQESEAEATEEATATPFAGPDDEAYPGPPTSEAQVGTDAYPAATPPGEATTSTPEARSSPVTEALPTFPATECDFDVQVSFAPLLEAHPELVSQFGCPVAGAEQSWAAAQPFERGNGMFWIENLNSIIALHDGNWYAFEDTYVEGEPESPPGAPTPPATGGLLQPIRGFGKVWATMVDEMGFAVGPEVGYFTTYQSFEGGWMLTADDGRLVLLRGTVVVGNSGPASVWQDQGGEWVNLW